MDLLLKYVTHYSIVPTFHQESSEKFYALLITQIPKKKITLIFTCFQLISNLCNPFIFGVIRDFWDLSEISLLPGSPVDDQAVLFR